jgi:hypothetical protein
MEGIEVGLAVGGDGFTIGCSGLGVFPGFSGGGVTMTSGG